MDEDKDIGGAMKQAFASHSRDWRQNHYVYPVLSRRAHGVSIGVNLNPDKVCNFDCIYCQVDRTVPPAVRKVDVAVLRRELDEMLGLAAKGGLFEEVPFRNVPPALRRLNDIAFSGDGEPTACPQFAESVQVVAESKAAHGLDDVKIVLITDACFLSRPRVRAALEVMDRNNGEIWAKLDAGTEEYYRLINRARVPLRHVMDNIIDAARVRPIVIQSLWMRIHGRPASDTEIQAFADRLNEVKAAGGRIKLVQLYTIARHTAEAYVSALSNAQLDHVASVVRARCDVPIECFYGVAG
ncbi:MAG TPA: radical SAM protein [Phycisphaerae bacterium]|nr:radical SAM protein [Phycisphaerae bacterium]